MTAPRLTGTVKAAQSRRLHFLMRDGTFIEGSVRIGEDQSLVSFLQSRRGGWMNVMNGRRPKTDEPAAYMIMQTDHIIFVTAPDRDVQVVASQGTGTGPGRAVEFVLVGGKTLRGLLYGAARQRLSDVVRGAGRFTPLAKATLVPDGRLLGDVALHTGAIAFARDNSTAGAPPEESAPDKADEGQ
jgi:hypothetical protein